MDLPVLLYSATATLLVIFILIAIVVFIVSCFHLLRRHRLTWKSSVSSAKLVSKSLDMALDGSIEQIDVERIINRRQERVAKSVEESSEKQEERICPLECIDNDTAAVLAVDQLLDTSFLISDEELACYAPAVDMEILAARRDRV
ncbi:unnamed protein product [Gongylonema pulchrum]|uniref:Uncharacterized protein n=1 Tax=Gongylonema pulchrum TaxID=637853 RepID=A0A183ECY6_9BILA|nr:unnamed protein product [Gongylonema pulchrum]